MAFKAEDGTGLADANSFVTVTEFMAYWSLRGGDYSDTDAELIQVALVKATDYMELRFGLKWKGKRVSDAQALGWPRMNVYTNEGIEVDDESVPRKIKQACHEYAKRALTAELLPDPTGNPNIASQTETVGPISTSITYVGNATSNKITPYPTADMLLKDLITEGSGNYR